MTSFCKKKREGETSRRIKTKTARHTDGFEETTTYKGLDKLEGRNY